MYIGIGFALIIIGGALTNRAIKKRSGIEETMYKMGLMNRRHYEDSLIERKPVSKFFSLIVLLGWGTLIFGVIYAFI